MLHKNFLTSASITLIFFIEYQSAHYKTAWVLVSLQNGAGFSTFRWIGEGFGKARSQAHL